MGVQIILGTPLFSADVFQWAGFRNALQVTSRHYHLDHSLFLQEKAQIILQNCTLNVTTQDHNSNSVINRSNGQSTKELKRVRSSKGIKRKNTKIN